MPTPQEAINMLLFWNQTMQYLLGFFIGMLVLIVIKTPAITFLKAFLQGKPIAQVKRKDGKYDFKIADYSVGVIKHPYGIHQIDPDAVTRDKKSGADIHLCLDTIGITLSDKLLMFFKAMQEMGCNNIDEIKNKIDLWRKCDECGYEGEVGVRIIETSEKDEETGEEKIKTEEEFICRNPDKSCESKRFTKIFPEIKFPTYKVFDPGFIDNYFMYNMNPRTNEVVMKSEVMNELDAEKKREPLKFIAIGIMIFMILMAAVIVIMVIGKMNFQAMGSISLPTAPKIPGLTG